MEKGGELMGRLLQFVSAMRRNVAKSFAEMKYVIYCVRASLCNIHSSTAG